MDPTDQRPQSPIPSRLPTPEVSGVNLQVANAADALRRVVDTYGFDITCAAWNWVSMENEVVPMLDLDAFPAQLLLTPQLTSSEPIQHHDSAIPTPLRMTPTMAAYEMPLHRSFTPFDLTSSMDHLRSCHDSHVQVHTQAIEIQFHVPPDDDEERDDEDSEEICILRL